MSVNFQAEIEVTACPANSKDWSQTFQIYPVGINEALNVNLGMQCDCPCENPIHPVSTNLKSYLYFTVLQKKTGIN